LQLKIKNYLKKLRSFKKAWAKKKELASESVNRVNSTKWRRQLIPRARSIHRERAVTEWWRGTWHCDRARRGGSEACSGGRCADGV